MTTTGNFGPATATTWGREGGGTGTGTGKQPRTACTFCVTGQTKAG